MVYTIGRGVWGPRDIWARFMACQVDLIVLGLLPSFPALMLLDPNGTSAPTSGIDLMAILVTLGLYGFFSSMCLSLLGSTPGKAIMGIHIREADGAKLSIDRAFSRQLSQIVFGLGVGIPLISLITLWMSYSRLSEKGVTRWDESLMLQVDRVVVGWLNWAFAIAIWIGSGILSVVIKSASLTYQYHPA